MFKKIFLAPINSKNKKRLFSGIVLLLSGIFVLTLRFTQPTIRSRKDLVFVSGQLNGHEFHDGTRGTHVYTFKIDGYKSYFKINANFLGSFDKAGFESIDPKEDVIVAISKKDTGILSIPDKAIFVYAIANKYISYLDVDMAIKEYNSLLPYYLGIVFIVLGLIVVYFKLSKK